MNRTSWPYVVIEKYYAAFPVAYEYLITHSERVRDKALQIADLNQDKNPNLKFIEEASLLHDIGIIKTDAPAIGCFGQKPYLAHGFEGRQMLEQEGYPRHAKVCERHIGVGITKEEICLKQLPIPAYDIIPLSLEEKIICIADKFYSKTPDYLNKPKSIEIILKGLEKYGIDKIDDFNNLARELRVLD